ACGAGESLVVIGGSGTGKSVLVKCILGILRPEAGAIRLDGEETVGARRAARAPPVRQIRVPVPGSAVVRFVRVPGNRRVRAGSGARHGGPAGARDRPRKAGFGRPRP